MWRLMIASIDRSQSVSVSARSFDKVYCNSGMESFNNVDVDSKVYSKPNGKHITKQIELPSHVSYGNRPTEFGKESFVYCAHSLKTNAIDAAGSALHPQLTSR